MKKILSLLFCVTALLSLVTLTACQEDEQADLLGRWMRPVPAADGATQHEVYYFDGKGNGYWALYAPADYAHPLHREETGYALEQDADIVTISYSHRPAETFRFEVTDTTLVLTPTTGSTISLTFRPL